MSFTKITIEYKSDMMTDELHDREKVSVKINKADMPFDDFMVYIIKPACRAMGYTDSTIDEYMGEI